MAVLGIPASLVSTRQPAGVSLYRKEGGEPLGQGAFGSIPLAIRDRLKEDILEQMQSLKLFERVEEKPELVPTRDSRSGASKEC